MPVLNFVVACFNVFWEKLQDKSLCQLFVFHTEENDYLDMVVGFQLLIFHILRLCYTDLVISGQVSAFSL